MNGLGSAMQNSFYYCSFKIYSKKGSFEEEAHVTTNTFVRAIFQTFSIGIVSSAMNRSIKASGLPEISPSFIATCTLTPLLLSTTELMLFDKSDRQFFQNIREYILDLTEYANRISSIALIILGQPTEGALMLAAGLLSSK